MMMFMLALLVLSTVVAAPTVISSIQREKEKEMVWRGRQYTRGIRMYYMKMRRFPTSLDDLTKPKNNIRFMRQAYKDPMNTVDGSWRLIYVGPSGQLIGSLNKQTMGTFSAFGNVQGMAANAAFGGNLNTNSFGNSQGSSSFGNSGFGNSGFGNTSNSNAANATNAARNATQGQGNAATDASGDQDAQNGDTSDQMGQPHPLQTMDASNTIGGNIIGVGSKVNKKSFLWYQKAKNYRLFEFVWDPSKDMAMGAASRGIGTPVQNGAPGFNMNPNNSGGLQNQIPNNGGSDIPPLQAPPPNQ